MIDAGFGSFLIEKYGSPIYAYDQEVVERRVRELMAILPHGAGLFYSFKANPLPAIGRIVRELGCSAEVSSCGELRAAIDAGFHKSDILYTGPGKTTTDIGLALDYGVTRYSCESWHELDLIAARGRNGVEVLLRINPMTITMAGVSMAGKKSHFGFDVQSLSSERIKAFGNRIRIVGVHFFQGTQIFEQESLVYSFRKGLECAEQLSQVLEVEFRILDVGGGFPWPFAVEGSQVVTPELGNAIKQMATRRSHTRDARLFFESGRYICASSGQLLTRVIDIREHSGNKFVILDAGINNLGGMSGVGRIPRSDVQVNHLSSGGGSELVDILGPLCSPLDCLGRNISTDRLNRGDVVSIPNVGAYGLTASLVNFTGRLPPVEVVYARNDLISAYRLRVGHVHLA